jgi:hypothetical protein
MVRQGGDSLFPASQKRGVPVVQAAHPGGVVSVMNEDQTEQLRRERDLLLVRFDPSEFDSPAPVFTELAEGSTVRDDLFPERWDLS